MTAFAEQPNIPLVFGPDAAFTFMHLLKDGLVTKRHGVNLNGNFFSLSSGGRANEASYMITPSGQEWVRQWLEGEIS